MTGLSKQPDAIGSVREGDTLVMHYRDVLDRATFARLTEEVKKYYSGKVLIISGAEKVYIAPAGTLDAPKQEVK